MPNATNSTVSELGHEIPNDASLIAVISLTIVGIVGVVGNILVILTLTKTNKLYRELTTKLVINLAIADLLFCLINVPLSAIPFHARRWPFGHVMCQIYPILFFGGVAVGLLCIMSIAINRMACIVVQRYYNRIFTNWTLASMIAFCWLFPIAPLLPPLFRSWGEFGYDPSTFTCTINDLDGRSPKPILFAFSFVFPCVVIFLSYAAIFGHVKRQAARTSLSQKNQRAIYLAKIFALIFGLYLICFVPSLLVQFAFNKEEHPYLYVFSLIMVCCNSAINPIVYFALSEQYRRAFLCLIRVRDASESESSQGSFKRQSLRQKLSSVSTFT